MSDVDPLEEVVPAGDGDRQSGLPVPEGAVPAEVADWERRFEEFYKAWMQCDPEESDEMFDALLQSGYALKAAKSATGGNGAAERRGGTPENL